jgi:lysophospholipase L1-like esterase
MKTVLCFGDSNTWGFDPAATAASPFPIRHAPEVRWTGVLARVLGPGWRVIEEGQNGRTTVHDDPFAVARNGADYLPACLESHKPLDLVVMMLGTNDLKPAFSVSPKEIAMGAGVLAQMILRSDAGLNGGAPKLLLVCPPAVGNVDHLPDFAEKFAGADERSKRLPAHYAALAAQLGVPYLDSQSVVVPSTVDAVHLDPSEHEKLGCAIAAKVLEIAP